MTRKIWTVCLSLIALLALGVVQPASACMTPDCWPFLCPDQDGFSVGSGLAPGGDTYITFLGNDRALIQVGTYTTPQMSITYACSTAFPVVPGVERIDGIRLVSRATGLELPNYHWVQSQVAAEDLAFVARNEANMSRLDGARWQGFFTRVENGSVGGIQHSFVFEVKLKPGTTPRQLVAALRAQGVVANGSANFDGTMDYGHYHFRRVADGQVHIIYAGREGQAPERRTRINKQ